MRERVASHSVLTQASNVITKVVLSVIYRITRRLARQDWRQCDYQCVSEGKTDRQREEKEGGIEVCNKGSIIISRDLVLLSRNTVSVIKS